MSGTTDLTIGAVVIDRDDADPNPAAVVNLPPQTAAEWTARWVRDEPVSLAEDNPEYPAEAAVAVVVFLDELATARPTWSGETALLLSDLNADGVPFYSFPEPRLRPIGALEGDESGLELSLGGR